MMSALRRHYNIKFRRNPEVPKNTVVPSGAGIVPFKVKDSKLLFLLGKERYDSNWRGSLCWSGFEGGNKNAEDCEQNATREFSEETLCIFGRDFDSLRASLEKFALKICFTFSRNNLSRNHVTFIKCLDVAHEQDDPMVFSQTRMYVSEIYSLSTVFRESLANIPSEYPFSMEGDVIIKNDKTYTIDRVNSVTVSGRLLLVELLMHSGKLCVVQTIKYTYKTYPTAYLQWFQCRKKMEALLKSPPNFACVDHPSITVTRSNDIITDVRVNNDYLEKVEIKWWSLPELYAAIAENENIFRPYFVPILKTIIDEFDDKPEIGRQSLTSPAKETLSCP